MLALITRVASTGPGTPTACGSGFRLTLSCISDIKSANHCAVPHPCAIGRWPTVTDQTLYSHPSIMPPLEARVAMIHNFSQARSRDDLDWPPPHPAVFGLPPQSTKAAHRDPVLLSAFFVAGLIEVYQLTVTLLHPPWTATVTDWLQGVLAYPELGVVLCVSWWFTRTRRPGARSWWMLSLALLSYIIAYHRAKPVVA